jgi:hypothetical protein
MANLFGIPSNFIDVPKGREPNKFLDCVEYLTHEHPKQQELGKYLYPDEEVKANFDFRAELNLRKTSVRKYGTNLKIRDQLRMDVLNGEKTLRQVMEEYPLEYAADLKKLKDLRRVYINEKKPIPSLRINFYIYGDGGIGKDLMSRGLARSLFPEIERDEELFLTIGAGNSTFEGYDGQPVIIWADKRAYSMLQLLGNRENFLNVFDSHPQRQRQNIKYDSINLSNCINIVNGVDDYRKFLDEISGEYTTKDGAKHEAEDKYQAYRRFPIIIPVHEEDYDIYINKGFVENTREYFDYIKSFGFCGKMQRLCNIFGGELSVETKKYTQQMMQPVVEQYTQIIEKSKNPQEELDPEWLAKLGKQSYSKNGDLVETVKIELEKS